MGKLKNPFAHDTNGNIIFIKNKDFENITKYDNCYCPKCKEKLVAKTGNVRTWHFAHKTNTNCDGNYESLLHQYAKEIVKRNNSIYLPSLSIHDYAKMNDMYNSPLTSFLTVSLFKIDPNYMKAKDYKYEWLFNEKLVGDFKPDCFIKTIESNMEIAVEILVTHKVDREKYLKVKKANVNMIEIDLSDMQDYIDMEDFDIEDYVLNKAERKWIFGKKNEEWEKRINNEIKSKENAWYEQEDKEYENEKRDTIKLIEKASLIKQDDVNINIYNIPVKGDYSFGCPRTVWQKRIIDIFINSKKDYIYIQKVYSYFEKYSNIELFNWKITDKLLDNYKTAIKEYFNILKKIHLISVDFTPYSSAVYDNSKIKVIGKENINVESELSKWNIGFNNNNVCMECGEVFDKNDPANSFYLTRFGMDKKCFEEYIQSKTIRRR